MHVLVGTDLARDHNKQALESLCQLPISKVALDAKIDGSLCTLDLDLEYYNPNKESKQELTYFIPLSKSMVLAKLEVRLAGRLISSQVNRKQLEASGA